MGHEEMNCQGTVCQKAECSQARYQEMGLSETGGHERRKEKKVRKKWVKAGGMLLAALLTACSGKENDESNSVSNSAVELDTIMSEVPGASNVSGPSQGGDEKDVQTQSNESIPQTEGESGSGSAVQAGQRPEVGSDAQPGGGSGSVPQADTATTPEPVREPIEEKLTPEGIGWGLSFGDSGSQPAGNASPQELALYDAYFMKEGDEKVIYLTFDCGYENGNTEKILDALRAHNAPATFFVVGHYLETEPEIVNRMVEEGHAVGNHTYHHYDIDTLDADAFQKELEDVEALFNEITGEELSPYYRPPEGKCGTTNLKLAKELGYATCFWSLAYVDWDVDKQPTHEAALDKLTARIHPGAIVLLHNTSKTNGEILDELLTKWEEMGYTFAPLSDLTQKSE